MWKSDFGHAGLGTWHWKNCIASYSIIYRTAWAVQCTLDLSMGLKDEKKTARTIEIIEFIRITRHNIYSAGFVIPNLFFFSPTILMLDKAIVN